MKHFLSVVLLSSIESFSFTEALSWLIASLFCIIAIFGILFYSKYVHQKIYLELAQLEADLKKRIK